MNLKRWFFGIIALLVMLAGICACAEPVLTDRTAVAWIGENNELFLLCTDGETRKLSIMMKDLLCITETEVICLTQDNKIVSVRKDGSSSAVLSGTATEAELAAWKDQTILLENGKLSAGEEVLSERAVAAVSDGLSVYWVNQTENGFLLMQKTLPGKELEAEISGLAELTGKSVPEPVHLAVTTEALTLTTSDQSILAFDLKTGELTTYLPSGKQTAGACIAGGRLYRYAKTESNGWLLEEIEDDAWKLNTVTPAPTTAPTPTPTPSPTPAPTPTPSPKPTETPDDGTVRRGDRGQAVRDIQKRLKELGYPVGNVDGAYGAQTQIAVNLFYDAIHMREHNYMNEQVQKKLFAKNAPKYDRYLPLQKGDQGLSVLYLQEALRRVGCDPGKLDGIYGIMTIRAVLEYQEMIDFKPQDNSVPGEYASRELLKKLYSSNPTSIDAIDLDDE